ncbi:MFS transporter [Endozoicomonadaceae bacterium StTr2]
MELSVRIQQAVLCSLTFLVFAGLYAPQPVLPYLADYFQTGTVTSSRLITSVMTSLAVLALPCAVFLRNICSKKLLLICIPLIALAELAFGFVADIESALTIKYIEGLLFAAAVPALMSALADTSEKGEAVMLYVIASVAGSIVSRGMSGYLISHGYHSLVWLILGGSLLLVTPGLLTLKNTVPVPSTDSDRVLDALRTVLSHKTMWAANLVIFLAATVFVSSLNYLPFHIRDLEPDISTAEISFLYSGYILALIGSLSMPKVWQQTGGTRSVFLAATGALLVAVGILSIKNYWVCLLGVALLCGSFFSLHSLLSACFHSVFKQHKRTSSGCYLSFYYMGGSFSSLLPGELYMMAGWEVLLGYLAGTLLLALFIIRRLL